MEVTRDTTLDESSLVEDLIAARVVDFGLARPLEDIDGTTRSGGQSPSTSSLRGGTPAYMAPERLGGDPGDLRSDQYSFCLTSLALVHSNIAAISIIVDDLEAVAEHTARGVAITRANYGDAHPFVAGGHLHLSTLKAAMGRPDEAVEEARTARRLFEAVHGPRHPHVALATCATAAALLARGDLEEALATAREGASLQAELLPAGDCDHLTCVAVEGTILHALGRHRETLEVIEPLLPVAAASQCTGSERDDLTLVVARALWETRGRAARQRILALLGALGAELDPESAAEVERLRAALG